MFPGLNPKKMQAVMKQMGINQEDIEANRVIIEQEEGNIIIENPSVAKVTMQGQETFQISGEIRQESKQDNKETIQEDITTIMEKTSCSKEKAAAELEKADGDIAEAIIALTK